MATVATSPAKCDCPSTAWGATGLMPAGHHLHFHANGFYLAHGEPSAEDAARYRAVVIADYERAVAAAQERRDQKLAAAGLA